MVKVNNEKLTILHFINLVMMILPYSCFFVANNTNNDSIFLLLFDIKHKIQEKESRVNRKESLFFLNNNNYILIYS